MIDTYILEGHTPVQEPDLTKWERWFVETAKRRVALTEKDGVEVSTVFLGLNHQYGKGEPLLFETMVFGGPFDEETERCSTWEEAEQQHREMVEKVFPAACF